MVFISVSGYSGNMDFSCREHDEGEYSWCPVSSRFGVLLTKNRARVWALVLDSRAIPCAIESDGADWQLLVPKQQLESAVRELQLYEEANCNWPPALPVVRQLATNSLSTLSVLLLLAAFYNLTHIGISLNGQGLLDLYGLGAAHAGSIREGEWWRCITSLTLHADLTHLLSNLAIGGIFILLLCRELGSGLAWGLLLASGTFGNLVNAWVQSPLHRSVGASTSIFGAVGILAAIGVMRRYNVQRRWFVPVAAGLALLALLGTEGKNTDLGAHLFGFSFGLLFGMSSEYMIAKRGRPGAVLNFTLALTGAAVVLAAWWAAIEFAAK